MGEHYLVQRDGATPLKDIVASMQRRPFALPLDAVTVEVPGHAIEGEMWAPQLAPFKPWVHDAALDAADVPEGTNGDLLIVGALGMGITDEERLSLIGDAVRGKVVTAEATSLTPHQLWEAGRTPPWRGASSGCGAETTGERETFQNRETSKEVRETGNMHRETQDGSCETSEQLRETFGGDRFALNVPLTVREDGEGYAVSAVHLSVLADHGLPTDDLVVALPSRIGDRPVTRIASEAFARRFTSGAQVRLLVVPDTVETIGAQAFGSVCAETIWLGRGLRAYDPALLDAALPSPRLGVRRFLVHPENKRFRVEGGCLLERLGGSAGKAEGVAVGEDGPSAWRLLFVDAPYAEEVALPEGVSVVGAAAFAKGWLPPRLLDVPAALERVDGSIDPETLWRSADPEALSRIAVRCGGRVTDFSAVERDGCWYRAAEGEAHLVAGPPAPDSVSRRFSSAAHARVRGEAAPSPRELAATAASALVAPVSANDRLALPREVDGAPLTRIAERALITAPATLAVPDTVRSIADGNAAKGCRKLMLAEGLRTIGAHCFCSRTLAGPVLIPASVTAIGEGSFEYTVVRLAVADAVVHITSDQLLSCFLADAPDGVPFDFERYDDQLIVGRGLPDHVGALLHRLAAPYRLAEATAARIVEALRDRAADAVAAVAREGDIAVVRALAERGFIDDATLFDRLIERLRSSNRTDCVLYLMNWHRERTVPSPAQPQRARDRFAL